MKLHFSLCDMYRLNWKCHPKHGPIFALKDRLLQGTKISFLLNFSPYSLEQSKNFPREQFRGTMKDVWHIPMLGVRDGGAASVLWIRNAGAYITTTRDKKSDVLEINVYIVVVLSEARSQVVHNTRKTSDTSPVKYKLMKQNIVRLIWIDSLELELCLPLHWLTIVRPFLKSIANWIT